MARSLPRLLAISQRQSLPDVGLSEWLGDLAAAGIDGVQLREKDLDDRALYELAVEARRSFPPPGCLLINGRADIALAVGADGVHLPADGVPVALLRRRFGSRLLLGVSTHHPSEVDRAGKDGADYVTFGPVYPTPSKIACGEPPGLTGLQEASRHGVPVLALGGLSGERFGEVARHGAAGVAGIRMFQQPEALNALVAEARKVWLDA